MEAYAKRGDLESALVWVARMAKSFEVAPGLSGDPSGGLDWGEALAMGNQTETNPIRFGRETEEKVARARFGQRETLQWRDLQSSNMDLNGRFLSISHF